MNEERLDSLSLVALRAEPGATNLRLSEILERFGSAAAAARAIVAAPERDRIRREVERVELAGARLLRRQDPDYPALLRETSDAPHLIFVRGTLAAADDPAVAVVGSRRATPEGRRIARALGEGLATAGITVVSGLARGIDGEAHEGALAARGRTLAVLGCGIDVVYPPEHRRLAERITAQGALLSELTPGAGPLPFHFPMRNRILAGLTRAVVVIEAAERSGSLITAHLAANEGRAVLAVPGSPLSPGHTGTNRLIQEGARLLQSIEDVIEELPRGLRPRLEPAVAKAPQAASDRERKVLEALSTVDPMHLDEVARSTALAGPEVAVVLLELELRELVARLAGSRYVKLQGLAAVAGVPGDRPSPCVLSSGTVT